MIGKLWGKKFPPMERAEEADDALAEAKALKQAMDCRLDRRDQEVLANNFANDIRRYLEVRPS